MKPEISTTSNKFVKIYRSFLQAGGSLQVDQIILPYIQTEPALHRKAGRAELDFSAFMYAVLRLPSIIDQVDSVILAQSDGIFEQEGIDVKPWDEVSAPARRRKMMFDGKNTLGVYVCSISDVDDMICLLTAFQIEWNKMHSFAKSGDLEMAMPPDLKEKFKKIWGVKYPEYLSRIKKDSCSFTVKLLRGSYVQYQRSTLSWFENMMSKVADANLKKTPVYFVSSNTHSLTNNITGYVTKVQDKLLDYLTRHDMSLYLNYWNEIVQGVRPGSRENFLWYVLKKYEKKHPEVKQERLQFERSVGIENIESGKYLDINAQVLSLKKLHKHKDLAKKLGLDLNRLAKSEAKIINIDYPLGAGAYMVLSTILRSIEQLKGVYILGKASFLNGNLGDIGLPSTVYETVTDNTYIFKNAFDQSYFNDFKSGNVLIKQKSIASPGTLLDREESTQQFFTAGFNILEMENGPYLRALYELSTYDRFPEHEIIDLTTLPVDLGIIHYASDTPYTKAITLATRNLGYEGVEATYTASLAILRRIIEQELINKNYI